ncbi:ABC transporter substrate-binding protein [Pseudonocardia sichuanensis]|uniref:Peptide/nickel transport system substrate-binding protein n=1 Tax=Pseudonocardia kunmingensis TaxID=630975 RepID=A0A543D9Q3_9PSEU|nr:ABC transporter substrate-binding protein [Pseudonocardia kunmingensis]TQM06067.1 peptide/nickel transport system substrate-binding protein [Pseudonocardia kunmingensis]
MNTILARPGARLRLAAVAVALVAAAACGSAPTGGAKPAADTPTGPLRIVAAGSPTASTFDPHGSFANEADAVRSALVYDALTRPDGSGGTRPALGESWEPDPDLRTWTITMRQGVSFSDGRPVRAADALYSLRRIARKGAENFGRLAEIDTEASSAPDDTTLRLVLRAPNAGLPQALEAVSMVVPEGADDFSSPVPGSGPFVPSGTDAQTTVLTRNDSWWGPPPPEESIELRAVPDTQARAAAVTSGQANFAGSVSPAAARAAEQTGDVQVVRRPGVTLYPLVMRLDTAPFDRPQVREAVKLAVDREQLVQTVFLGLGTVGDDVLSPDVGPGVEQRTRDVTRARALLAEAGFPDGLDVELRSTSLYPGMDTTATLVAQQLAEAGIRVQVTLEPPDTYFSTVFASAPFYVSYYGGIPFTDIARVALVSQTPANETAWRLPEWDTGFAEALGTADDAQRAARLGELQRQIQTDGGYVVWGFGDGVDLAATGVTGAPTGPGFSRLYLDQLSRN